MRIVYLDQNKWIELARAAKYPAEYADLRTLLEAVNHEVRADHLVLPLSAANIYETYKIYDPQQRHDLASVQAALSRGVVFRGRYRRLEEEVSEVLRDAYGIPPAARAENWFLSKIFLESVAESGDARLGDLIPDSVMKIIRDNPTHSLYNYMVTAPDEERVSSVSRFSDGSERLRLQIENRRGQHKNEPLPMRRKIYGAMLLIDEVNLILGIGRRAGIPWETVSDMGGPTARRIVRDVPTYYIERELALRLETQNRPIDENDFRDMQSFCTVVPYADEIIVEKQFASLAEQAKLDQKYDTRITTDIFRLREYL